MEHTIERGQKSNYYGKVCNDCDYFRTDFRMQRDYCAVDSRGTEAEHGACYRFKEADNG